MPSSAGKAKTGSNTASAVFIASGAARNSSVWFFTGEVSAARPFGPNAAGKRAGCTKRPAAPVFKSQRVAMGAENASNLGLSLS